MEFMKSVKSRVMRRSRLKKLDHFYSLCDPDSYVLDVGVSGSEKTEEENMFHRRFRFPAHQYTGLSINNMADMKAKYPDYKFVEYTGSIFPFGENQFDWAFSNAVIEHVGNSDNQLLFLNEMLRTSRNVFFTTPNKWFPVESHTNTIFRHWHHEGFYKWCARNNPYWGKENLLLLGASDLLHLLEKSTAGYFEIRANKMVGWPMTYTVVCTNRPSI